MSLSSRKGESWKGILEVTCNRCEVLPGQKSSALLSLHVGLWTMRELHRKAEPTSNPLQPTDSESLCNAVQGFFSNTSKCSWPSHKTLNSYLHQGFCLGASSDRSVKEIQLVMSFRHKQPNPGS